MGMERDGVAERGREEEVQAQRGMGEYGTVGFSGEGYA